MMTMMPVVGSSGCKRVAEVGGLILLKGGARFGIEVKEQLEEMVRKDMVVGSDMQKVPVYFFKHLFCQVTKKESTISQRSQISGLVQLWKCAWSQLLDHPEREKTHLATPNTTLNWLKASGQIGEIVIK